MPFAQDALGYALEANLTSITDQQAGVFSRSMAYDGLNRLRQADAPGVWGSATFSYDAADNLRTANVGSRAVSLEYADGSNRLTQMVVNGSAVPLGYDSYGNVRSRGPATYGFDLGNRMFASSQGGSYAYDGLGRRTVVQSTDGSARLHAYGQDGLLLLSTSNGGGRPTSGTLYFYLGRKAIAQWNSASGTQFMHTDALGSPVARTSIAGPPSVQRTRFEPFGAVAQGSKPGPVTGLLGFTGHVQDGETDLVYMQQRY